MTRSAVSRRSQNASASTLATRQAIRWHIPAPLRPAAAPGYSKNVMMLPGVPRSSP